MILPRLGRWNGCAGRWFIWQRIWRKGYIWTPFCRVSLRSRDRKKAQLKYGDGVGNILPPTL